MGNPPLIRRVVVFIFLLDIPINKIMKADVFLEYPRQTDMFVITDQVKFQNESEQTVNNYSTRIQFIIQTKQSVHFQKIKTR